MTDQRINRQSGLWDSPITPISLAGGISFSDLAWDESGALVWREQRSDRGVLVVQPPDGQARRDLNSDFSARARVGYGGGDFTVGHGMVYFAEAESGRLYRQPVERGQPFPVTPAFGSAANPCLSPDGNWLLYVHTYENQDSLAIVDSAGSYWPARLVSGEDFYMQPCWHPAGRHIAWIAWNHPNMPWDGTYLYLGTLEAHHEDKPEILSGQPAGLEVSPFLPALVERITVAGGRSVSIFQPQFSPDGRCLAYVSDESGWWQLYLYDLEKATHIQLTSAPAEHAAPAWVQGMHTYAWAPDGKSIFYLHNQNGFVSLWQIPIRSGKPGTAVQVPIEGGYTWMAQPAISPDGKQAALIASGIATPLRIIRANLARPAEKARILARSSSEEVDPAFYSPCQAITWTGMDGGGVYGLFYPPHSPTFHSEARPALIVHVHGGPTSQEQAAFHSQAQYFTSRGYAYLEVNYRGSTGYGRAYRDALLGKWGIYDVEDSVSAARHLAETGQVDADRMVIMGGSAGGFTVLKALEDFPGVFKAGICLYGVSNQFTLAAETHKFEAHYSDSLIGPLPEAANLYRERSPIFFVDKIRDPLAIFQGENDVVVPRNQSDSVVESLRRRGIPHEYHLYPGEGHGFHKTGTIKDFYEAVDRFLRQFVIFS